ncbi:YaaA family protein [Parasphingorhabdus litoris]|uniref:YaaA family protein n=1 Tax=Parasphingorhabdus litoris TaxID=394733 RepID=UPI002DDB2A25|nr:YaaA family protein [Parasphingorhabdus litoris]
MPAHESTQNRFPEETKRLAGAISNLSKKKLKSIMPVSDNLIDLNHGRYNQFFDQPERAAIFAYSGDVYTGFEAQSLDKDGLDFAKSHLRILSGLYGLLRPFDPIRPHRLEMGTKWAPRYKKLTDFWKDKIATELANDLNQSGERVIVNLASNEYWAAVKPHADKLNARIIEVDFRKDGPDGPKFISFEAKRARGMMARYICENHLQDVESLKGFDSDGYQFDAAASTEDSLRFVRS